MSSKETQDMETEGIQENEVSKEVEGKTSIDENARGVLNQESFSLENELHEKVEETARLKEQFLRLQAETDNFKKRITREKNDFSQFANERLLKEILPIYENLERALSASDKNPKSLKEGLKMISKQFAAFLEKEKVKPIPAVGEKFDPSVHEALSQAESDKYEENMVIQEFTKGFFLNDRVLIPAKVVISKKPVKKKQVETSDAHQKDSSQQFSKKPNHSEKSKKKLKQVTEST